VADNLSGNNLKIDVFTDRVIWERAAPLPPSGAYSCQLEFTVAEPRVPVQIRVFNGQGAIEGTFRLSGIALRRSPSILQ
jgi:hypothetical protein